VIILKKLKLFINFCCILVLICFLNACSNQKSKVKKIKLSETTRSIFYAPQYVAFNLGYFKEEGLNIELITQAGSDQAMTSILSNQVDIGLMGSEMVAFVNKEGKENFPIIFTQLTKKDGSFLVSRKKDFSWEDLKGKTIIAGRKGGLPEMTFRHILKKKALVPNQDVKLLNNIKFDLMAGAFLNNTGDYVTLFEPTASILEENKNCFVVKSLGEECEEIAYTCYAACKNYVRKNPNIIKAFTKAISKAQNFVETHDSKEIAEIIFPYFSNTDKKILERSVKRCKDADVWASSPVIKKESFEAMQNIALQAGELKSRVNYDDVVDNQFALQVSTGKKS
jgi:NitT/TauT family transport system substrate-binding protein